MDSIYVIFGIVIILVALVIIVYRVLNSADETNSAIPATKGAVRKGKTYQYEERNNQISSPAPSPSTNRLTGLKQELVTMAGHNQRVYESNLEIARRDYKKRNKPIPSDIQLHERAIEIWRDDNR